MVFLETPHADNVLHVADAVHTASVITHTVSVDLSVVCVHQVAISLVASVFAFVVMMLVEVIRSLKHTRKVALARRKSRQRRSAATIKLTPTLGFHRDRDFYHGFHHDVHRRLLPRLFPRLSPRPIPRPLPPR